ncbi:hypothetical protein C7821_11795 [Streptomyces sp. VMFN-G11Ma]|jgi:hypothetical protein|nr:hypothetical protein C7821_11795 [Streptomyces sp. VMFN-G11Ma]
MAAGEVDPRRVLGVLLIGSFAQCDADGLDFLADLGLMSVIQFRAAERSAEARRAVISQMAAAVREHEAVEVASAMASLLPRADAMVLDGVYGVANAVSMHHGLAAGYAGWL